MTEERASSRPSGACSVARARRSTLKPLLELYARYETELEKGAYRPYTEILGGVVERIAEALSVSLDPGEREILADFLAGWPVFFDTRAALRRLSPTID